MEVIPSGMFPDATPYHRETIPTGSGGTADILVPDPAGPNSVRCLHVSAASPDRLAADNAITTWQEWLALQPPVTNPFTGLLPGAGAALGGLKSWAIFGLLAFVLIETRGWWRKT